jgi:hypothetical protein
MSDQVAFLQEMKRSIISLQFMHKLFSALYIWQFKLNKFAVKQINE